MAGEFSPDNCKPMGRTRIVSALTPYPTTGRKPSGSAATLRMEKRRYSGHAVSVRTRPAPCERRQMFSKGSSTADNACGDVAIYRLPAQMDDRRSFDLSYGGLEASG